MLHNGDSAVLKVLYSTYASYLTGVCTRYLSDLDDVKDVLHDSFLKIFASVRMFEYRGKGSLKAWLTRIVVNESLKFIRRAYRLDFVSVSQEQIEIEAEEPELDGISMAELHRMICELPPGYRTVFNLYVFEEKSHKEIAEILDIKESTSASQLHRAKALLATKIRNYQSHS
ncbi:MAG: RNA polymerase sigma factor [Muribaculaceae bacterium]|nr:RNA polymerase sigma factor [Muribaculaceae bacterium]